MNFASLPYGQYYWPSLLAINCRAVILLSTQHDFHYFIDGQQPKHCTRAKRDRARAYLVKAFSARRASYLQWQDLWYTEGIVEARLFQLNRAGDPGNFAVLRGFQSSVRNRMPMFLSRYQLRLPGVFCNADHRQEKFGRFKRAEGYAQDDRGLSRADTRHRLGSSEQFRRSSVHP